MDVNNNTATPKKIQELFSLIDYFDENTSHFKKYESVFKKEKEIIKKRNDLLPLDHYTKKIKDKKLLKEQEAIFKIIDDEVKKPIIKKVQQLEITNFSIAADMKALMFNKYFHTITDYVKTISSESEAKSIIEYKNKYVSFRNLTRNHNLGFSFFFSDLDELLRELFKDFRDRENLNENYFFDPRMFTLEYYKEQDKKEFQKYYNDKTKGLNADDDLKNEINKNWLDKKIHKIEQNLSDTHPNGKPKGRHLFDDPFYSSELKKFKSYLLNEYSEIQKPQQNEQSKTGYNKADKTIIRDLKDLFADNDKYTKVMQILAENRCIDENTKYWTDENGGTKGFLASLIKHLHTKKYLTRKPNNDEVKAICKKTFGLKVSTRTVAGAKQNDYKFNFIPPNDT